MKKIAYIVDVSPNFPCKGLEIPPGRCPLCERLDMDESIFRRGLGLVLFLVRLTCWLNLFKQLFKLFELYQVNKMKL